MINVDECKKHHVYEKDYVSNPSTCSCNNKKYLASIMHDSGVLRDEVIESYNKETKAISIKRKQSVTRKISIF